MRIIRDPGTEIVRGNYAFRWLMIVMLYEANIPKFVSGARYLRITLGGNGRE